MSRDDAHPTPPRREQATTPAEQPTATLPETPPTAPAEPSPSAPDGRTSATAEPNRRSVRSRAWMIAGAAAAGVLLLGLAFGGGVATGFALDSGRGGPVAGPGHHPLPGSGHGREDGDGPATPPRERGERSDESTAPTP